MDFEEPKLPEAPCFKPPSPVTSSVKEDSPKLSEVPSFKPPAPEIKSDQAVPDDDDPFHGVVDDLISVGPEVTKSNGNTDNAAYSKNMDLEDLVLPETPCFKPPSPDVISVPGALITNTDDLINVATNIVAPSKTDSPSKDIASKYEDEMDFGAQKLPESPCFKPPSPVVANVLSEAPKLPESPCFKPPSPDMMSVKSIPQEPPTVDDLFSLEPASTKIESDISVDHGQRSPAVKEKYEPEIIGKQDDDYTRRETKTFDTNADLIGSGFSDGTDKKSPIEFGGGDLPPSHLIQDEDEIPPPIPKHSWEIEKDIPPPVPPHSITSDYSSVGFHSSHASSDFPIHATYDDKIDDEFDEDSLSKPLSHKLSDSLEVLKESPQKDHPMLDESLMDLDDLPSSSKNSVKSISPNDSKNVLGDFSGADADVSAPVTSLPSEMTESGLFSQQPPKELDSDSLDIDEKMDFKQVQEVEYTKPVASIPPFSAKIESMLGDAPLPSTMTSSMIMNTSLDEMQAPKFYESEDSSSKTDAPADEMEKAQAEPDRNLELQEFEEAIPESMEESGTPASDSGSSKIEVLEIKPTVKAEPEPVTKYIEETFSETYQEAPVAAEPKQKIELDTEAFELSEEMQLLLNTLKPSAWFDPSKLHPTVGELVYWRDPKKSGVVFGSIFVVLLALTLLSLISVVAYTSLAVLSGTFAFRVYKSVLQAVQKTQDGHPFKQYLDLDVAIPSEKAQELSNAIITYFNTAVVQLRRLFLVEDLVDSAKFGVVLYLLTYIGGWFNGLTLLILGFVALFSLPKVYETNKTVIDQYIELINSKISEVNAKVTAAVPFLKKEKAQ
ncbi:unnamed protein product [Orchesella dallaii]|uniref:Reticulon-like protein n=1 Tax=Orchesella dallaii TaxID=48710 RepID=A0ABP1QTN1_9HEXA